MFVAKKSSACVDSVSQVRPSLVDLHIALLHATPRLGVSKQLASLLIGWTVLPSKEALVRIEMGLLKNLQAKQCGAVHESGAEFCVAHFVISE